MRIHAFSLVLLSATLGVLAPHSIPSAVGQELRTQATPFSVWLDFEKLRAPYPPKVALPIWLESVQTEHRKAKGKEREQTTYRLRLRRMAHLNSEIQLRLFFKDKADAAPNVSAWTETGTLLFQSALLGDGLGLSSSATLLVAVEGADYVDIAVPGDGSTVRGVFTTTVKRSEARTALDFAPNAGPADPFGAPPALIPEADDLYLYGRIKATLQAEATKLEPGTGYDRVSWQVQLDSKPPTALVVFEVLDMDVAAPPVVTVNDHALGAANAQLPDLADPGFRGDVRAFEKDMRFRYTGWVRCQKLVPASTLNSGLNHLEVRLSKESGPVAVRAVEIQLKHHWRDFDYTVTP